MAITVDVDLRVDLQTMDETGLPWTFLDEAPDPSRIVPGRHIVAGSGSAIAVAVVVDITEEGVVHVHPLSGSVASNVHLLEYRNEGADPASERLSGDLRDAAGTGGMDRDQAASSEPGTPATARRSGP